MILKDILAISGEPGLFRFVAQGKNAIIVENLETGKRSSAFSSAKVSSLEDISVFTDDEDLPLAKVFDIIYEKESGGVTVDSKSDPEKLRNYFEEIIPNYAREKVYASDIKKIFLWYNLLHKKGMLIKEEPGKQEDTENKEITSEETPAAITKRKKGTSKSKE